MADEENGAPGQNDEEEHREEESEREEKGEDEGPEEKVEREKPRKMYFDEMFGEEFDGEGQYYPMMPPSDFDLFMGTDSKTGMEGAEADEQEKGEEAKKKEELGDEEEEEADEEEERMEEWRMEEEVELAKVKEEGPEKSDMVSDKASLTSVTSSEYGMKISEYFIQPKDKTPSEIQFETDYREIIEEKMKKIIRPMKLDEEEKKVIQERKPIEKKKLQITEFDVSDLYPQPKAIESEVSFAFEEDDEGEKKFWGVRSEADVVLEQLIESLKYDRASIFATNATDMIQKVKGVIEEVIKMSRRRVPVDVKQKVFESLSTCKSNLKINLHKYLADQVIEIKQSRTDDDEPKPSVMEGELKVEKMKKKLKAKLAKKLEKVSAEGPGEIAEEEEPLEAEATAYPEMYPTERPQELPPSKVEEEEKVEEEMETIIPYEKIDWNAYLSESERQLALDPTLRLEMETYIESKRLEFEKEQKLQEEKRARKLKYKNVKDPQEMLRNVNLNVTMKFVLNTGDMYTCAYRYFMPFGEIKEDLAGIFKVPPDVFIIYRDEVEIRDEQTAFDLEPEIEPFESVTFRLLTLDNDRWQLKSEHLSLPVPDIITCTVETGTDHRGVPECKEVVVEIENRKIKKPFVGGFRDCVTGIEYHHAFSQSAPRPPKLPWDQRISRDTQTKFTNEKLIDTTMDKSTQMARRDYYVSTEFDKIMTAKPYVDYEHWYKQRDLEGKIRTIQRYVRAMILRKCLRKMSEEYRKRKCWEIEEEQRRVVERENRIKTDIINMTYPKTKADFDMLYALVEKWRKAQIERISKLKTEAPKKAELCLVLEKEIKLLEAIEVHRIAMNKHQKRAKALKFMEKVAEPVTWTGFRGLTVKMDTLKTQRARELKELYQSLARHDTNYQDRIELLISLKHALSIHCTSLTEELTRLINQECEMLIRGVRPKDLEYLRQRIELLFQEYFKDPQFNPEAAKHDPTYHKEPFRHMIFCKLCHQMKQLKEFSATARDKSLNVCSSCQWTHNIAVPRVDLNPYRYILKMVRKDEQKRNCYSSCAFILQDEDMRFLVENIWKNRSAVSEYDNLIDLRMPRWDVNKDWTPWNCILLTELEAKAHLKTKPSDNYEQQLLGEIVSKHELAKKHFGQLFATATRLRDSGKWANVVDVKEYSPPPVTADIWSITPEECLRLKKTGQFYEVHETRRKHEGFVQYI